MNCTKKVRDSLSGLPAVLNPRRPGRVVSPCLSLFERGLIVRPFVIGRRDRRRCGSVTLVELMVVAVIMTAVVVALVKAVAALLTIQQNYREETAVLEQLATEAARIERGLSLAKGGAVSSNGTFNASFFMEAGGVSFETNYVTQVSKYGVAVQMGDVYEVRVASDPRHDGTNEQSRPILLEACTGAISMVVSVEGTQAVRRLTLTANIPVKLVHPRDVNGVRVYFTNESVTVERPVRLWNSF